MRVRAPGYGRENYAYPDGMIMCEEKHFDNTTQPPTLLNPTVLIEIASESTRSRDFADKLEAYFRLDSLKEYWIVDADQPHVVRYERASEPYPGAHDSPVPTISWRATCSICQFHSMFYTAGYRYLERFLTPLCFNLWLYPERWLYSLLSCSLFFQPAQPRPIPQSDWLIQPPNLPSTVHSDENQQELYLDNGLLRRRFRLEPNAATVGFDNLITGTSVIRAVKPESGLNSTATGTISGALWVSQNMAYLLPEWVDAMQADPKAFVFENYDSGPIEAHLDWKQARYASNTTWPPPGIHLALHFRGPETSPYENLRVTVHYNLYDNLPLLSKWFTIENEHRSAGFAGCVVSEILGTVEAESFVEHKDRWKLPPIHMQSDYTFGGTPCILPTTWLRNDKPKNEQIANVNPPFHRLCITRLATSHAHEPTTTPLGVPASSRKTTVLSRVVLSPAAADCHSS